MEKQVQLFYAAGTSIPKEPGTGAVRARMASGLRRKGVCCKLENRGACDMSNPFRAGTDLGRGGDEGQASVTQKWSSSVKKTPVITFMGFPGGH